MNMQYAALREARLGRVPGSQDVEMRGFDGSC